MIDRKRYCETFSRVRVSPETRRRILSMEQTTPKSVRRLAVAVAAVLAVTLSATAVVTFGGTMTDWFAREWAERTGGELSEGQTVVIDSLTQKVGQSVESEGVTVTVDSITVGTESLWVLLDAEGLEFDPDESYTFGTSMPDIQPDPNSGQQGSGSWSISSIGVTENGGLRLLLQFTTVLSAGTRLDEGGYTLELSLGDLSRVDNEREEIVCAGEWVFSIPLTAESLSPVLTIESAVVTGDVMVPDGEGQEERQRREVVLYDLRVTATGLSFRHDGEVSLLMPVAAVLENGTEVRSGSGGGSRLDDGSWYDTWEWPAPLDISDIAALRIGETEIPLQQP